MIPHQIDGHSGQKLQDALLAVERKEEQLKEMTKLLSMSKTELRSVKTQLKETEQMLNREKAIQDKWRQRHEELLNSLRTHFSKVFEEHNIADEQLGPLGDVRVTVQQNGIKPSVVAADEASQRSAREAAATEVEELPTAKGHAGTAASQVQLPQVKTNRAVEVDMVPVEHRHVVEALERRLRAIQAREEVVKRKDSQSKFSSKHLLLRSEELQLLMKLHLTQKQLWGAEDVLARQQATSASQQFGLASRNNLKQHTKPRVRSC